MLDLVNDNNFALLNQKFTIFCTFFQGSFRMFGVKASRLVFLFSKGVIIAKRKEDGMLGCKAYIPVSFVYVLSRQRI